MNPTDLTIYTNNISPNPRSYAEMMAQQVLERSNGLDTIIPVLGTAESENPQEPRTNGAVIQLSKDLENAFREIKDQFTVNSEMLRNIVEHFQRELADGLAKENQNIAMYPTWVFGLPNGQELGQYLTIDLGGTNLRVCCITLKGQGEEAEILQDMYRLPGRIKTGQADELWNLIADSLSDFLQKHHLGGTESEPLPLGFTFSYPVRQDAIDRGTLVTWTKGFDIKGVEGEDVVLQLGQALERRKLPVQIVALVNDTVGALLASAYNDPETIIGAIFGTGCNAAYMEDVGSVTKIKTPGIPPQTPLAINCEYGAFDNDHQVLPRTKYDIEIDNESPKPGEQAFEKMSAGLYLGEIFRLVLVDLHERGLIFRGREAPKLKTERYCLDTGLLSCLENDGLEARKERFRKELHLDFEPTAEEVELARLLAEAIAIRGARLCACGIAAICRKKGIQSGHVAADGSVANKHPKFRARWAEALGEVLGWAEDRDSDPITLTRAEDGSGIGAAIITAMTCRKHKADSTRNATLQD